MLILTAGSDVVGNAIACAASVRGPQLGGIERQRKFTALHLQQRRCHPKHHTRIARLRGFQTIRHGAIAQMIRDVRPNDERMSDSPQQVPERLTVGDMGCQG